MNWRKVKIKVNRITGDAVINIMEELGAQGVVFEENKENLDLIEITAYYPDNSNFNNLFLELKERIEGLKNFGFDISEIEYDIKKVEEEDWTTSWQEFFHSYNIGKTFKVCPEWENCRSSSRKTIKIKPGMAFGIGGHESTQLVLESMEKYLEDWFKDLASVSFLDVGTGTGILSIAAAKMGIKDILAIDKDDAAVESARKNVKINKLTEELKVQKTNIIDLKEDKKYDIIAANLLTHILVKLLPQINSFLKKGGLLIISGITDRNSSKIKKVLSNLDLSLVEKNTKEEWVSFLLKKDDDYE